MMDIIRRLCFFIFFFLGTALYAFYKTQPDSLNPTLDTDAVARLLDFEADTPLAIRDNAMMELFYSSGLRLSELAALRWDQVDPASGLVRVTGKGNKDRIVPVGSRALDALARWHRSRGSLAAAGETALFVSRRGTRLSARAVEDRLHRRLAALVDRRTDQFALQALEERLHARIVPAVAFPTHAGLHPE